MNRRAAIVAASFVSAGLIGASAAVAAGTGLFGSPEQPGVGQLAPVLDPGSVARAETAGPGGAPVPRQASEPRPAGEASEPQVSSPGAMDPGAAEPARATPSGARTSDEADDDGRGDEWEDEDAEDDYRDGDRDGDREDAGDSEDRAEEFDGHDDDD